MLIFLWSLKVWGCYHWCLQIPVKIMRFFSLGDLGNYCVVSYGPVEFFSIFKQLIPQETSEIKGWLPHTKIVSKLVKLEDSRSENRVNILHKSLALSCIQVKIHIRSLFFWVLLWLSDFMNSRIICQNLKEKNIFKWETSDEWSRQSEDERRTTTNLGSKITQYNQT